MKLDKCGRCGYRLVSELLGSTLGLDGRNVIIMHALSWLWLSCMRSLYAVSDIMHDVDILI